MTTEINEKRHGQILIEQPCRITGELWNVTVDEDDYNDWKNGKYAQDAFPYLSADEREFIISGTSPEGWKKLYGSDD
jgi:hypothetical protein